MGVGARGHGPDEIGAVSQARPQKDFLFACESAHFGGEAASKRGTATAHEAWRLKTFPSMPRSPKEFYSMRFPRPLFAEWKCGDALWPGARDGLKSCFLLEPVTHSAQSFGSR